MSSLDQTFAAASPRLSPPPTPLRSILIHGFVLSAWVVLFASAFLLDGPFAWSVGFVYIGYDITLLLFVVWQTLPLLRQPPAPVPPPKRATVGVIVAAHDEAAVLPATLAALFAQNDPPDMILIADDGSADDSGAVLARLYGLRAPAPGGMSVPGPAHPALRWLRLPRGGKARALNAAIVATGTDVVLTVDADTLIEPDAIGAMRLAFSAEPELVAATGVFTPVCAPSASGRILQFFQTYEYTRNFLSRYSWMRADSLLLISGAFAGFRRDAVIAVGGFDTECLVEDYEVIHRLRRHAAMHGLTWRTRVLGQARGRTDAPATIPAFLRQRRRWFGGFLQTQYWYRAMVGDRRYGLLGTLMLPVKAFDTIQPIYGLSAFGLLVYDVASGRFAIAGLVAGATGVLVAVNLAFHLWSLFLYRRWAGGTQATGYGQATLAALIEPFSFNILRQAGAVYGWIVFLTGQSKWGRKYRTGLMTPSATPSTTQAPGG